MSDLISRDALLEHIDRRIQSIDIAPDPLYRIAWEIIRDWIEYDAPTVDAVPVVHARWVFDRPYHYKCSACSSMWSSVATVMTFCPNCGAKMDGGAANEH